MTNINELDWLAGVDIYLLPGHSINPGVPGELTHFDVEAALSDGFVFFVTRESDGKIHAVPAAGVRRVEITSSKV